MALRRTPFYRVLYRSPTVLSGEREPVLMTLITAGAVAAAGMNIPCFVFAAVLSLAGLRLWRWLAKEDPQAVKIYIRKMRTYQQNYYAPRARPSRDMATPTPAWIKLAGLGALAFVLYEVL